MMKFDWEGMAEELRRHQAANSQGHARGPRGAPPEMKTAELHATVSPPPETPKAPAPAVLYAQFKEWPCEISLCRYMCTERLAIRLIDTRTKEPIATATVNLTQEELTPDEVFIKNYGENEGMLQALVEAGLVVDTGRMAGPANVCTMTKLLLTAKHNWD